MTLHRGRMAIKRSFGPIRELTRKDLEIITPENRRTRPAVDRFRDTHHRVARFFAMGLRPKDIAKRTGYSLSRTYLLSSDPAFQELVAKYREEVTEGFKEAVDDYFEMAVSNMHKAERMLSDKLDEADAQGELPSIRELVTIASDRANRFGYAPKTVNLNVSTDLGKLLDRAIARSGKVLDIDPVRDGEVPQSSPTPGSPPGQDHPLRRLN